MKIACVGYLHGFGGAERQIIMLANNLAYLGHEVSLISLAADRNSYKISSRVKFVDLSVFEKKIGKIFNRYSLLRRALAKIQPAVTINFWFQSAYLCTLMPKSICGKIIYAERGDPGNREYAYFLGIVRWLSFKRIDGFVFQSKGAQNYFNEFVRQRSVVIPNAHSIPENFLKEPCSKREKRIVSVGRLHPQKNQIVLIKAFASIVDEIPEYELDVYGDGELRDALLRLIKELHVENRVHIHPSCKNIYEKMYCASLFVLSSDYEGMPNALMEAMALGVPCISTDCHPGGARELIKNGENGWIVPVDNAKALADKIRFVIKESPNVELIVKNALKIRLSHSKDSIYKLWFDFINKVV